MGEPGQASVEWVATLLLVAIALTALTRLAGRADGTEIATAALKTTTCAARGGCKAAARASRPQEPEQAVTAPPLLPVAPGELRERHARARLRLPPDLRRRAGALWRRAWLLCFGYERGRYSAIAPESRVDQMVSGPEALRMVNDCVSPVDLVRDWDLLTGR